MFRAHPSYAPVLIGCGEMHSLNVLAKTERKTRGTRTRVRTSESNEKNTKGEQDVIDKRLKKHNHRERLSEMHIAAHAL